MAVNVKRRWRLPTDSGFLLFLVPALAVLITFRYVPIVLGFQVSTWHYSLLGGYGDYAGLENYTHALLNSAFWNTILVTVTYSLLKVPAQIALGLGLALLLQGQTQVRQWLRAIIFVPTVMSIVVASVLWSMMYHSQIGLINGALTSLGLPRQPFLTSGAQALPSIVVMVIWKDVGLTMLILLAGLEAISKVYYDAARVDGASPLQTFRYVTLPMLRGALVFVLVTETINAMQVFVPMYTMTQGGPGDATRSVVYNIYQYGFQLGDMGYASAMSMILVVIIVTISLVQRRLGRGLED